MKNVTQIADIIRGVNGSECFGDLRVDFQVDGMGRCWFINACSQDYLDFLPLQEFKESPHKQNLIKSMTVIAAKHADCRPSEVSELERKRKCGFCHLEKAISTVRSLMTAQVLVDTYETLALMAFATDCLVCP